MKVAHRHWKVQHQRKDFAVKSARCVVASNDVVALEDLQVRNRRLAKSIHDAMWSPFGDCLVYFGKVFGKPVVKVPPEYTSQDCSECGNRVRKSLSERSHVCNHPLCGCAPDVDALRTATKMRHGTSCGAHWRISSKRIGGHSRTWKVRLPKRLQRWPPYYLLTQDSKGCL